MPKKREMTKDESDLYNQMKKLAKVANQRMLRLERLTGITEGFATKQLLDLLSIEPLQAVTKKGRVAVRKSFNKFQMEAIIRGLNAYINKPISTVAGVKQYVKDLSEEAGQTLTFKQADIYYQAEGHFKWIIDYFPSTFWDMARESVTDNWSEDTFVNIVGSMLEKEVDEDLLKDLKDLYEYTRDTKV